jgi:phosphatidylinositol alpha-1,6-mannosyltransferase
VTDQAINVVGLFPSWSPGPIGGIQRSGRETWEAIVNRIGEGRGRAICYEPGTSKARAVLRAIRTSSARADLVLVWHLDLLKLLPFLDLTNARVALFLHGIEAWRKQTMVTQLLLRKVDLILTNTDHTWSGFIECNPSFDGKRHRTTHLGLGTGLGTPTPPPSRTPAALMISRLDARQDYKGHRQVIAAWPLVLERTPRAQLWIVGGGDLQPQLEQLVRDRGLGDSVRFFGQVSDCHRDQLMADCRCFAMPSRGDGFGLVYLEAMRMGRPCLVSTLDAGREVVNPPEAGLAVDPGNPKAIAEALTSILGCGEQWERWSVQARTRYECRFTSEHFRTRLITALFDR